jgi:hypothetical protein
MIIVTWDGKNLPSELRNLPPGTYALEPAEDAPTLSPEEEEGLRRALRSIEEGRTVDADEARRRIRAASRR